MGKSLFHEKLQGAVGNRGLVSEPFRGKPRQHVVGAQRLVLFQQDFQHPAADRRQTCTGRPRQRFGPLQRVMRAVGVVMRRKGQVGCRAAGAVEGGVHRCS